MKSGLKVLVDGCNVSHDTLPVWPLCVHHLINVLEKRNRHFRHYIFYMMFFTSLKGVIYNLSIMIMVKHNQIVLIIRVANSSCNSCK